MRATVDDDPATQPARTDSDWNLEVIGSRGLLIAGLVSLMLGAAYFVQLTNTQTWISPEARIIAGIVAGLALLLGGAWRIGEGRNLVAEGVTGLGASLLYLSVWAAFGPFHLIGQALAFGAMVAVSGALATVAWRKRRQSVALIGLVGAFITPPLLAAGPLPPLELSVYLCVVCGTMLALAVRCNYRLVEGAAFVGALFYAPALSPGLAAGWTTNDALAVASVLFLEFVGALLLAAERTDAADTYRVALLGSEVVAYAAILDGQLHGYPWALAGADLALAAALLGTLLLPLPAALRKPCLWLALAIATRAAAVWSDGHALGALFALEGAVLIGVGIRGALPWLRGLGYTAFTASVAFTLYQMTFNAPTAAYAFNNAPTWSALACIAAAVAVLRDLRAFAPLVAEEEKIWYPLTVVGGTVLALAVIGSDVVTATALPNGAWTATTQTLLSLLAALVASALVTIGFRYGSTLARWVGMGLFGLTIVKLFAVDLSGVDMTLRIVSTLVVGTALVAVAGWYELAARRRAA